MTAESRGISLPTTRLITCAVFLSVIILGVLVWWIYFKNPGANAPLWLEHVPVFNACMNSFCVLFLILGYRSIQRGLQRRHVACMISALFFSLLFLLGYLFYHHYHGDTRFMGTGWIRPVYFFILISHIVLSFIALPLVLTTLTLALKNDKSAHKKVAKWTFPIWLYVSATGVLITVILKWNV